MLSASEIARGVQGALLLLRGDRAAPFSFDSTVEACARSFRLMLVVAPLYIFYLLIEYMDFDVAAETWQIASAEGLRYLLEWLLYPVLFYEIARRRGWLDKYFRYITALNWINLPAAILLVIGACLMAILPSGAATIVSLAVTAVIFYWFLVATRLMLGVSWPMAGLLLVVNVVPMMFISMIINRVLEVTTVAV
jgi:hypothetical protein